MSVVTYFLSLSPNLSVTSPYGPRIHPVTGEEDFHEGVDIAGEPEGFPTPAPVFCQVKVAIAGHETYGNYVRLQITSSLEILIAHLKDLKVTAGQFIAAGTNIGGMGKTGQVTGTHWHIETRINGVRQDPATVPLDIPEPTPLDRLPYASHRIIHRRHAHKGRR